MVSTIPLPIMHLLLPSSSMPSNMGPPSSSWVVHHVPIVIVMLMLMIPIELVPLGYCCFLLHCSLLALTISDSRAGVGAGLSIIVVGCWAVPCKCRALVLGFVITCWLSVVVVGHGLWVPLLQHVYDIKLMKTVSLLKKTSIKLTWGTNDVYHHFGLFCQ